MNSHHSNVEFSEPSPGSPRVLDSQFAPAPNPPSATHGKSVRPEIMHCTRCWPPLAPLSVVFSQLCTPTTRGHGSLSHQAKNGPPDWPTETSARCQISGGRGGSELTFDTGSLSSRGSQTDWQHNPLVSIVSSALVLTPLFSDPLPRYQACPLSKPGIYRGEKFRRATML